MEQNLDDPTGTKYFITNFSISPRVGYEFHDDFKKFQLIYGMDIRHAYSLYKQERSSVFAGEDSQVIDERKSLGLSPFIGLRYRINKRISITTETSFEFLYNRSLNKTRYSDDQDIQTTLKGFSTRMNPLGIFSFNIHF
ncbi:MAG: hypothetical protein ACRCVT_09020 [Leadbetterella sp.]